MAKNTDLNAVALKTALWETLQSLQNNTTDPAVADSIASQAREILRTSRTQLQILSMANQPVSAELIEFARPNNDK